MSTQQNIPALLRSHGLRLTAQRLAVAELVLTKPIHITARMAYESLIEKHPSLSMNTIYLTLGQFESSGLLKRFEVGGNAVFDSNTMPHDHAYCSRCKAIVDLTQQDNPQPQPHDALKHWHIEHEQRIWNGTCPDCAHIDSTNTA